MDGEAWRPAIVSELRELVMDGEAWHAAVVSELREC